MAIAFQNNAFQNNAFQTAFVPQPAFQNTAFQSNAGTIAFQTTTTQGVTGADSWPADTYKKRHKQLYIGRGQKEYDEILDEITARLNGTFGLEPDEEIEDVIDAVIEEKRAAPALIKSEIIGAVTAQLEARLKFQAEMEARVKAEMLARLIEEDDEEVMLLI